MNLAVPSDASDGRDVVWDARWRFSAPASLFVTHKTQGDTNGVAPGTRPGADGELGPTVGNLA